MKTISQSTGVDQDANNVQLKYVAFEVDFTLRYLTYKMYFSFSLDEQRRKTGGFRPERKAIALEAVLDTKCRKCGGSGEGSKTIFKFWTRTLE